MNNKNNHNLETKDESTIHAEPLTEGIDCESPVGESDDKNSADCTDDKPSMQNNQSASENEEEQPLHAGWLKKFGWSFVLSSFMIS